MVSETLMPAPRPIAELGKARPGLEHEPRPTTRQTILTLVSFWLALLPLFVIWLQRDLVFAPWDEAHHAGLVLKLHDRLARGNPWSVFELSKYYPPLFHVLALPATLVSTHPDAYCFGNWLALLALMLATCWIGRSLLGPAAGLAAGLLVPAYAYVSWMGRMVMTDLTLAATVAVTVALLARPDPLRDARAARWLGASLGLGMLAKWSYAFFLALPLAAALAQRRRSTCARLASWSFWREPAIAAGVGVLICGPWYVRSVASVLRQAAWHFGDGVRTAEGDPPALSLASLRYYPDALRAQYLTPPLAALLVLGAATLIVAALRRRTPAQWAGSAAWLRVLLAPLSGWLCLVAITNKDFRYILPVVSVLAVLSVTPLSLLGPRSRRASLATLAILSYGLVWLNLFRLAPPNAVDWQVERTAEVLADRVRRSERPLAILVVPNDARFNFMSLAYATERLARRKLTVDRLADPFAASELDAYDAVVTIEPPLPETILSRGSEAATRELARGSTGADEIRTWRPSATLPVADGHTIRVLVRGSRAGPGAGGP
jgi:hypothetical protein